MKTKPNLSQSITGVALGTVLLLLVPLVAMQFTDEVNWSVSDFIVAGVLLFGAGLSYVLAIKSVSNVVFRTAFGLAIGSTLLMVWANLAVGLIGSGPNPGNLMYIGVLAVAIISAFLSRFTPKGMQLAMFITALALVVVAVIELLAGMHRYPASSVTEIIGVNTFFAALFAISGMLFRHVGLNQSPEESDG